MTLSSSAIPPTYDRPAVLRWQRMAGPQTPWLHEEVARRMFERLQWIRVKPQVWTHWTPLLSGQVAHASLAGLLGPPESMWEPEPERLVHARRLFDHPGWHWRRWLKPLSWQEPGEQSQDMVWANMALHANLQPQALVARWHRLLRVDGFLMFSCLGPDAAVELRNLYEEMGWPPIGGQLTDMHDWGDMLVANGFAEPVMDMEKLTLTFDGAERLLAELRQWGRNVHPERFSALRGRRWRAQLLAAIDKRCPRQADGRLGLTVELIYGHALRPPARIKVQPLSALPLDDMKRMLKGSKPL